MTFDEARAEYLYPFQEGVYKGIRREWWPAGEYLCGPLTGQTDVDGTSWALTSPVRDGLTSNDWELVK